MVGEACELEVVLEASGSTVRHLPDKILGLSVQMTSKTSTTSQNELNPRRQCNNDARMVV